MWEELLEDGVVGEYVDGGGGVAAGEKLSWWDVDVSKGFFGRERLVGRMKLVLLVLFSTNSSHCEMGVQIIRHGGVEIC